MTPEELDFLFDLLREERRLYEESLKPNKYRLYNLSSDTKKKYRKQLKLVEAIESKLLHVPSEFR